MSDKSLYERLGGYDVIVVAVDEILPRLMNDSQLGRFWQNRGRDDIARERQRPLCPRYLCNAAGGPMYYTGRDMKLSHVGKGINEGDWSLFTGHIAAALDHLSVGEPERGDVLGFIESLKGRHRRVLSGCMVRRSRPEAGQGEAGQEPQAARRRAR